MLENLARFSSLSLLDFGDAPDIGAGTVFSPLIAHAGMVLGSFSVAAGGVVARVWQDNVHYVDVLVKAYEHAT